MGRRTTPVSPARAGGAPQEKPSTREKILAAALSLFAQRGFEETSVQDIALAVGVKAASLYSHFPGKAAIFRAVLSGAMDSWSASIEDCFRGAGAKTSLEEGLSKATGSGPVCMYFRLPR
jgi:AcrR family transcriptional regulator